jgi:hypothetical protein
VRPSAQSIALVGSTLLTLPDGKMLFLGSSGTGAPYELTPENQKK